MSNCLRPIALAFILLAAFAQSGLAGVIGFSVAPSVPAPDASLETKSDGSIVATNINVTAVFGVATAGSTPTTYSINAYLDFSTGSLLSTDANGVSTYSSQNANFFILGGPLESPTHGAGTTPLAYSVDMLTTVIPPSTPSGQYTLTASLLAASVDPTVAQGFGMPGGQIFTGTFSLSFIFDSTKAGDQVSGGGFSLTQVIPATVTPSATPAPPSVVLAALGLAGTAIGRLGSWRRSRRNSARA